MISRPLGVAILFAIGCAHLPSPPAAPPGVPATVTTQAGSYDGYRVVRGCRGGRDEIGVIGTGARRFDTPGSEDARLIALRDRVIAALKPTPAAHAVGIGGGCLEAVAAMFVMVDDWRAMDGVIAALGAFLRDHDLAEQAVVVRGGRPVMASRR